MTTIMTTPRLTLNPLRLAFALLLLGLGVSYAQTPPAQLYTPVASGFTWRDNADEANGVFFTVGSTNTLVSHLGYFNGTNNVAAPGGLKRNHPVGIYSGTYNGSTVTSLSLVGQVTVPTGTSAQYYNNFWWVQLDPPILLKANTVYVLAGQGYNGDGDWWQDATVSGASTATWNAAYVGTSTARGGAYGPGGTTWPLPSTAVFTRNGLSKAYVQPMLGNLSYGPAKVLYPGATSLVITGLQSFTLTAYTAGQTPITGQWWQNGTAIPGATGTIYSVPSAWDTNTGTYYFTATNTISGVNYGQQTPNISVLVATYPGNLAFSPATYGQTQTLFTGANANFALTSIAGLDPISYYWYTNGTADDTATGLTTYSLANVRASSCPTNLSLVITNPIGAVTNTWLISVVDPPTQSYPANVLADHPVDYWRVNETPNNGSGNNGLVANDYVGGNASVYSNSIVQQTGYGNGLAGQFGYTPATDTESSAQFGYYPTLPSTANVVPNIQGVSFATPANTSGAFSVETWAKGDALQRYNAGIVAKGAWAAEQFTVDNGGNNFSYRFTMRNANGGANSVGSNTNLPDGNWHHLVGVVNQASSNICFYVDSVLVGSNYVSSSNGVLSTTVPVSIGARMGSGTTAYNQQFFGNINDVATYNYALSSMQVSNHYTAAGIGAHCFTKPVTATSINQGADLIVPALVIGTAPLGCQWYDVTGGGFTPLANETNATLIISNIQAAGFNSHTLALVCTNFYGQATNQTALTVYTSPVFTVQPTNSFTLYAGGSASGWTVSVATVGPPPIGYNWLSNGVPIPFATNATYTITGLQASTTIYSCWASNSLGSATGGVVTVTVLAPPSAAYPAAVLADRPLGYWRLNETSNGTGNTGALANDYWGGNNGVYSNTILGQVGYSQGLSNQFGYYPATDPTESSAQFGYYPVVKATSNLVASIPNINFAKTNASATFSIEAWANGDVNQNGIAAGGIVAKGAWAAEQFTLDTGGTGSAYRFNTRDAVNTIRTAGTSTNLPDGKWHHLVGVLDEVHSNLCLYVDGVQVATTLMPTATNGVLSSAVPVSIGSRQSSGTSAYGQQFFGSINDVAIYNYALSSTQVVTHYLASGIGPWDPLESTCRHASLSIL